MNHNKNNMLKPIARRVYVRWVQRTKLKVFRRRFKKNIM